jgi:hypothetical protein
MLAAALAWQSLSRPRPLVLAFLGHQASVGSGQNGVWRAAR